MRFSITDILIYGSTILLVIVFSWIADHDKKASDRVLCAIIIVLIPSLLAGLRANTVGTDVALYAEPIFNQAALSKSLKELYEYCSWRFGTVEIGFLFLARVVSLITNQVGVFLFLLQAVTVFPVVIIAYKNSSSQSIRVTLEVYMFLFYGYSLNIMRESIAVSWFLLAYIYFTEQRYFKMALSLIVAVLFHNSVVIGIALYIFALAICRIIKKPRTMLIFIAASGIIMAMSQQWMVYIINILLSFGIIPQKYSIYINAVLKFGSSSQYSYIIGPTSFVEPVLLMMIILMLNAFVKHQDNQEKAYFYQKILMLDFVMELASVILLESNNHNRITIYYTYILLLCVPYLCNYAGKIHSKKLRYAKEKKRYIELSNVVIEGSMFLYFFLIYIFGGWHHINFFVFR